MKGSVKKQIWIRIAVAILALVLIVTFVFVCTRYVRRTKREIDVSVESINQAYASELAHFRWSNALASTVYDGVEFTGSTDDTGCVLGKWIYGDHAVDDDEVIAMLEEMKPLHKAIHSSATQTLSLLNTDKGAAITYYKSTVEKDVATLVEKLNGIVEHNITAMEAKSRRLETSITIQSVSCIAGVLLLCITLWSLVHYVFAMVVRPILKITEESKKIAEGSLDFHVDFECNNELGELATSLETSVGAISGYVDDIGRVMGELAEGNFTVAPSQPYIGDFKAIETSITEFIFTISDTLSQIENTAEQVSMGASQIADSSQSLAQGATEQASAVQQLSATITEISNSSRQNATDAGVSMDKSKAAGGEVMTCNSHMEEMIEAMKDITNSSQEIGKILKTIEDISFQTNILALNAAVEAARAGTAGKGFAVVADEVRNLASKSDQAAKATRELIQQSINSVDHGSEIVDNVSSALHNTTTLAKDAVDGMVNIAKEIENESEAISQVTIGIDQISSVIQINTATSEESAAASQELSGQAQILKEYIKKFKLNNES